MFTFSLLTFLLVGVYCMSLCRGVVLIKGYWNVSGENAIQMARAFSSCPTTRHATGAMSLRGAWNFQTPPDLDAVVTLIFKMIELPAGANHAAASRLIGSRTNPVPIVPAR